MKLLNINSSLKLRSALAHFGRELDAYCEDGKDIRLFKMENCENCGCRVEGPNSIVIVKARKFVKEWLEGSRFLGAPSNLGELSCTDEGACVCETCYGLLEDAAKENRALAKLNV
jgi:hypothetical protein